MSIFTPVSRGEKKITWRQETKHKSDLYGGHEKL